MTWHYLDEDSEPCTYSPEPEGESSPTSSSDTYPSALSSLIPTAGACCSPGSETASSPDSRSGMTSRPSTGASGAGPSTSSPEGSPVPTFPAPAGAQASTESSPGSGEKWPESFARYDPDSRSWRTAQCSLLGGFTEFSETWPRWGLMRGGECWELSTPARRTSGSGSGYSRTGGTGWPTPNASDGQQGAVLTEERLTALIETGRPARRKDGGEYHTKLLEMVIARKAIPTPTCGMAKTAGGCTQDYIDRRKARGLNDLAEVAADGMVGRGTLNPTWVEWLMNWPLLWTRTDGGPLSPQASREWLTASLIGLRDCEPLETARFLSVPHSHGRS